MNEPLRWETPRGIIVIDGTLYEIDGDPENGGTIRRKPDAQQRRPQRTPRYLGKRDTDARL